MTTPLSSSSRPIYSGFVSPNKKLKSPSFASIEAASAFGNEQQYQQQPVRRERVLTERRPRTAVAVAATPASTAEPFSTYQTPSSISNRTFAQNNLTQPRTGSLNNSTPASSLPSQQPSQYRPSSTATPSTLGSFSSHQPPPSTAFRTPAAGLRSSYEDAPLPSMNIEDAQTSTNNGDNEYINGNSADTEPSSTRKQYRSYSPSNPHLQPHATPSTVPRDAASSTVPSSGSFSVRPSSSSAPSHSLTSSTLDPHQVSIVHPFLRSLYAESLHQMPECELTPYTVDALATLAETVRLNNERAGVIEEEYEEATKEYAAEASRISSLLARLNLHPTSFSSVAQENISTLSSIAQTLALKNVDPISYISALLDTRESYESATDSLEQLRAHHSSLVHHSSRTNRLITELRALRSELRAVSEKEAKEYETHRKQIPYFQIKQNEYQQEQREIEQRLTAGGYAPHLSHSSLVALSNQIAELSHRMEPLDQQLATYQQLPPDLTLARIRLAEAYQQLQQLEDQFAHDIREME